MRLEVQSRTQRIEVDVTRLEAVSRPQRLELGEPNAHVSIVNAGPQGPPGVGAGAASSYFYTQAAPASSWVINHNLGFRPNVTVEEAGTGDEIMCAEIHHSVTQVELQFNIPRAGTARLS